MKIKNKFIYTIIILILLIVISLIVGRYSISIETIIYLIKAKLFGLEISSSYKGAYTTFFIIRLPRTFMAVMVGGVLGVSGCVFQGIFKNPLVSPDILGVSAAGSFGASLAIITAGSSIFLIQISAFSFSLIALSLSLAIGINKGKSSITSLVLGGIVVSSVFSAGTSILKYLADPYSELPAIEFWSMGAFNRISWRDVILSFPIFIICLTLIFLLRWYIDVLSLGEEEAISLGVNVKIFRIVFIILASLMTATSIAYCGIIGWISLIIPHISRFIVGAEHKNLIPYCALSGAMFTLIMDTVARTITAGEIPISIITASLGAPFLGYLLIKYNKNMDWM